MDETDRVPMSPKRGAFVADGDVELRASLDPTRMGRKFEMVVDEELLRKIPKEAIAYAIERLSEVVVHSHQREIRRTVEDYIHNREWAEPIIREATRDAVREIIREMLAEQPTDDGRTEDE